MNRAGVALIETLIALVILASAGISTIGFVTAVLDDGHRIEAREVEVVRAERTLIAQSLLTRSELEQRLGERVVGLHVVRVERPLPSLFRISVASAERPALELVVTVVYRQEEVAGEGS